LSLNAPVRQAKEKSLTQSLWTSDDAKGYRLPVKMSPLGTAFLPGLDGTCPKKLENLVEGSLA
jgi:hypothetical protein